jgi:hypothetical protein
MRKTLLQQIARTVAPAPALRSRLSQIGKEIDLRAGNALCRNPKSRRLLPLPRSSPQLAMLLMNPSFSGRHAPNRAS